MPIDRLIGWDLGGAHLKLAQVDLEGRLLDVSQLPCPIWKGLEFLDRALDLAGQAIRADRPLHAVTMTAELADIFHDRRQGVQFLIERFSSHLRNGEIRIFAGRAGLLPIAEITGHIMEIASANWLASASFAAQRCERGILVDIGSTTTDLLEFRGGKVCYRGYSDAERLHSGELVYTGVVRTPVMVIVNRVPFEGEWQTLAAEHFATMADVYQLTGRFAGFTPPVAFETADRAGQGPQDCARRLARMLGRDLESADLVQWQGLAHYIAHAHQGMIRESLARILSRGAETQDLPLIGAGIGRFLVRELAAQVGCQFIDFSELVDGNPELRNYAAVCAPATALAYLARSYWNTLKDATSPDSRAPV